MTTQKRRIYQREYYRTHKEKLHECMKKYYEKTREQRLEKQKAYNRANKERLNAYSRKYYRENKRKWQEEYYIRAITGGTR